MGDGYGRPLEFIGLPRVRTAPAGPGHDFHWTDDTHMALYLAEAALDHGPGPLDIERFAHCVGTQFVRWLEDPLTPSTAPGNTCLAGTRAWRRSRDWTQSGVRRSDGCGAVMRVCPLPITFDGEELLAAASTQALITHGHPNAPDAAVAACWITRRLLLGEQLEPQLVRAAAGLLDPKAATARALLAAVDLAQRSDREWLDEAA